MQKLAVLETVKDAMGYTLSNITLLMKASMVWLLSYVVLAGAFGFFDGEAYIQLFADFSTTSQNLDGDALLEALNQFFDNVFGFGRITNFLYIAMFGVSLLAYYSIAIAWHRACLLDEEPPLLRLGGLEFRYFGYSVLLIVILYLLFAIISLLVSFLVGFVVSSGGGGEQNTMTSIVLSISVIGIFMLLAFGRFSLAFPGIAVRDRRMNFRTSFKATKGNSWRILGGTILCVVPALVISLIANLFGQLGLPLVVIYPIVLALQLLGGAFLLSYMSICYQILVPSPDEGDLA